MHRNAEWFPRLLLNVAFTSSLLVIEEDGGISLLEVAAQQSVYASWTTFCPVCCFLLISAGH